MAAVPSPQHPPRPLPTEPSRTGVTLRVDFATGRILGPIEPATTPAQPPGPSRSAR